MVGRLPNVLDKHRYRINRKHVQRLLNKLGLV